jgi:7-cyano-7-deazaguanine reductase
VTDAAKPAGFGGIVQLARGTTMADYTEKHARAGINAKLPQLETWPNQFQGYIITTKFPEYSSVCPKTGMPDYGTITIQYRPRKECLELKALKMYLLAYRDLGIFYENAVNKILRDIVKAVEPEWCVVRGDFTPRGGLTTSVFARWPELQTTSKNRARRASTRRRG